MTLPISSVELVKLCQASGFQFAARWTERDWFYALTDNLDNAEEFGPFPTAEAMVEAVHAKMTTHLGEERTALKETVAQMLQTVSGLQGAVKRLEARLDKMSEDAGPPSAPATRGAPPKRTRTRMRMREKLASIRGER